MAVSLYFMFDAVNACWLEEACSSFKSSFSFGVIEMKDTVCWSGLI